MAPLPGSTTPRPLGFTGRAIFLIDTQRMTPTIAIISAASPGPEDVPSLGEIIPHPPPPPEALAPEEGLCGMAEAWAVC